MNMMEYLLEDLWIQIFLRLPLMTILQCQSVCKSWKLFIQQQSFFSAHLQHQRRDLMLVRYLPQDDDPQDDDFQDDDPQDDGTLAQKTKPEAYSLHIDDEDFSLYVSHEFPIIHPAGEHYRVVGICNGIICITDDQFGMFHDTYLWNPTIRKCIELPRPMYTYENVGNFHHELGFGYDEKTNDYKVVRVVEPNDFDETPLEVEIYSVSSGIWKDASYLASNISARAFEKDWGYGQVYLNGAAHWVGHDSKPFRCLVIAFHVGDEVFSCFEPPLETVQKVNLFEKNKLRPLVFRETLSLLQFNKEKCCIWMMKVYGDSSSWMKHLDLDLSMQVQMVFGVRSNGELLVSICDGLYSYDPEAMKGKQFIVLDQRDLLLWKRLQEGENFHFRVPEHVRNYDPEAIPRELGIRSETMSYYSPSFHCERYRESLALLGSLNPADSKGNGLERIHDEENSVAGLTVELQHLGKETEAKIN